MIKVGLIGSCGNWAQNTIRNILKIKEVKLTHLCDLDNTKLERLKEKDK